MLFAENEVEPLFFYCLVIPKMFAETFLFYHFERKISQVSEMELIGKYTGIFSIISNAGKLFCRQVLNDR